MHYVYDAARAIAEVVEDFTVVVIKSTVPIGAGDEVERILQERLPRDRFAVVSNPEFLREGAAIKDFKQPDRVVIGVDDERARAVMGDIYQPMERAGCQMIYTSRRSSEMIKYAANVFLAMKVTFINEIADLCERLDADVMDVSRGVGLDDRIGAKFLNPGPGFGGSCFPKDTLALTKLAIEAKAPIRLVETLVEVNDKRKLAMAAKVVRACGGSVAGKRIAVLGLTYKPKTDDMRDAPSLVIIPELQAAGAQVAAYDPEGVEMARAMLPGVEFADNAYACLDGADAAVVITEWDEFRALDLARVKEMLATPILVDLRNIYSIKTMKALGFRYVCVGRGFNGEGSARLIGAARRRDPIRSARGRGAPGSWRSSACFCCRAYPGPGPNPPGYEVRFGGRRHRIYRHADGSTCRPNLAYIARYRMGIQIMMANQSVKQRTDKTERSHFRAK